MSFVLSPETPTSETVEATIGRFFGDLDAPTSKTELSNVLSVLASQKDDALEALRTLSVISGHRITAEHATAMPTLAKPEVLDEAKDHVADLGTIWRRQTDRISRTIATELPRRRLGQLVTNSGYFLTSDRNIYEICGMRQFSTYYSLSDRKELNFGVQLADETQWHNFLFRLTTLHI